MSEQTGGCLCGQVRYRITAAPVASRICWCRDCQRTADSGSEITRRFCANCGSHVLATSSSRPDFAVVRIGTLDDPSALKPVMNVWTISAPSWVCFDPALEQVERQPQPPVQPTTAT